MNQREINQELKEKINKKLKEHNQRMIDLGIPPNSWRWIYISACFWQNLEKEALKEGNTVYLGLIDRKLKVRTVWFLVRIKMFLFR